MSVASQTAAPTEILNGTRTKNIFADIKGFPSRPNAADVINDGTINPKNIQGDILSGMIKQMQLLYFFSINDAPTFKQQLNVQVMPMITSVYQLLPGSQPPLVALNVAFSQSGLTTLGINDNVHDPAFTNGQAADANNLGDAGTTNWVPSFIGTDTHGVFLMISDQQSLLSAQVTKLEGIFGASITNRYTLNAQIRPAPFTGHEMFGWLDGIGQPAVAGFNLTPNPGQQVVDPGVILTGYPGDSRQASRPPWMTDGSFLVFRQLKQLVPEFSQFLLDNAPQITNMTQQQSAGLLGARMFGRWKSGAPVDIDVARLTDDPPVGADPLANNNFDYSHANFNSTSDESHCPFAAHIRKVRPRSDQDTPLNAILRTGIPYGPEVTPEENQTHTSSTSPDLERGLAFVCYQSCIDLGFQFIQTQLANQPNMPEGKDHDPGYDPIIGQNNGGARYMAGYNVDNTDQTLSLPTQYVISRGGEYFFSPSLDALQNVISV